MRKDNELELLHATCDGPVPQQRAIALLHEYEKRDILRPKEVEDVHDLEMCCKLIQEAEQIIEAFQKKEN